MYFIEVYKGILATRAASIWKLKQKSVKKMKTLQKSIACLYEDVLGYLPSSQ